MKFAIRKRFNHVVNDYILKKHQADLVTLSETMGISDKELTAILEERAFLTVDAIARFSMAFPKINIVWILTGVGKMIREKRKAVENYTVNSYNRSNNTDSIMTGIMR